MGVVWAATHTVTRRTVAMKFLRGQAHRHNVELRSRFLREARAARPFSTPTSWASAMYSSSRTKHCRIEQRSISDSGAPAALDSEAARATALRREMHARLHGKRLSLLELEHQMGRPDHGDKTGAEIFSISSGAFDQRTVDRLGAYLIPFGCIWFAVKGGRVVGSGVFNGPRD